MALSRVMAQLDYDVLVFDTRHEISTLTQNTYASSVLSQLYAPVGLPIGSHTPEEIAISIAAQIIQERRKWLNPVTDWKNAR